MKHNTKEEKPEKEYGKPIAARVDQETYQKINALEKAKGTTKANIIRDALQQSYNTLILTNTHTQIFEKIVNERGHPDKFRYYVEHGGSLSKDEDNKFLNPFENLKNEENRGTAAYQFKDKEYETKDEKITFTTNKIFVKIECETDTKLKIKTTARDLIDGHLASIPSETYMKILQIISREGFRTETSGGKKEVSLNMFFEITVPITPKEWIDIFEKRFRNFNKSLTEISKLLEKEKTVKRTKEKTTADEST